MRMKWARHVACMREMRNTQKRRENLKRRDRSEEMGVDGKKISEWTFRKQGGKVWTVFVWFRIETSGGLLRI
jgi:predicted NUDIX family NTP pyrophosphohydrolase